MCKIHFVVHTPSTYAKIEQILWATYNTSTWDEGTQHPETRQLTRLGELDICV